MGYEPKRIAVFGGTFDPFHHGHLSAAQAVREHYSVDAVHFVLSEHPPHKTGVTPLSERLKGVEDAVRPFSWAFIAVIESYMAEFVDWLMEMVPNLEILLVVGSDIVPEIDDWHRADDIKRMCELVVVARPGYEQWAFVPHGWTGRCIANVEFSA